MEEETVIDLFAGPGGLGTGFKEYFQVDVAVDWDEDACATYSENHPETDVRNQDVRDVDYVRGDFSGVIGVIGGPPCQEDSVLNRKADPGSKRGLMVKEMLRAAEEINPQFLMIENVPRFAEWKKKLVVDKLKGLGYRVNHGILRAHNYGSVQKRPRWIVFAHRGRTIPFPEPVPPEERKVARSIMATNPPEQQMGDSVRQGLLAIPETQTGKWVALPGRKVKNYYILHPDKPIGAVSNHTSQRFVRPNRTEYCSFLEIKRAQGFPDDYALIGSNWGSIGQQLANAVPVEMSTAIARSIAQVL